MQRGQHLHNNPALQVDQICTWRKVLTASGFAKGFLSWWSTRPVKLHGSPDFLPVLPPRHDLAKIIFYDFRANYKTYERWQLIRKTKIVAEKAFDHNRLLYKQLRQHDPSPPEQFAIHYDSQIALVSGLHEVELVDDFNIPSNATWTLQGEPVTLTFAGPSRANIDTDLILAVGQTLHGVHYVTTFEKMEQALAALWTPIWQRHQDLHPQQWDRAIAFARAHLPRLTMPELHWSGPKILRMTESYKKKAATGPDGWSRLDVASLPESSHDELALMFQELQTGVPWPVQLVTGMVCPVRKHQEALKPTEYRPIILLSFLYRLWAAGASRLLLSCLGPSSDSHIYGYVQGRRAADLWFVVQAALECSFVDASTMVGHNLDLVRCFNLLPRAPLLEALSHMGAPTNIMVPGKCALWSETAVPHLRQCGSTSFITNRISGRRSVILCSNAGIQSYDDSLSTMLLGIHSAHELCGQHPDPS